MVEVTNTNGTQKAPPAPFKIERTLWGVANAFLEVSERVASGTMGISEAREATRALSGVPAMVKTQLEVIKVYEKGSEKARQHAAKILDVGEVQALPKN